MSPNTNTDGADKTSDVNVSWIGEDSNRQTSTFSSFRGSGDATSSSREPSSRTVSQWDNYVDLEGGSDGVDGEGLNNDNDEAPKATSIRDNNPKQFKKQKSSFDVSNHDQIRKYIKHRSSLIEKHKDHKKELSIDETRLAQATRDAGHYAYGVVLAEVWILDEDDGRLKRAEGGYWRNPKLPYTEQLARIEDPNHPKYVPAAPRMPGVDLAGVLWATCTGTGLLKRGLMRQISSVATFAKDNLDSSKGKASRARANLDASIGKVSRALDRSTGKSKRQQQQQQQKGDELDSSAGKSGTPKSGTPTRRRSSVGLASRLSVPSLLISQNDGGGGGGGGNTKFNAVVWRDMKSLQADPDTAKGQRLGALLDAGFGIAAGITFESWDAKGLVVYMAKSGSDIDKLSSLENQVYLVRATEMIGSVLATRDARRATTMLQSEYAQANESANKEQGGDKKDEAADVGDHFANEKSSKGPKEGSTCLSTFMRKVSTWIQKCKGGDMQIPPVMPLQQSLWTLCGVFCGLIVLSQMNEQAQILSDGELELLIGPFGALMTLMYGLTPAPASQPRNAILGQAVAGAIALSFTYIPEDFLPTWIRRAIAPAFAIAAMCKLGIPHPPAGAHSVIYASGRYGWKFYLLVVLGSIISVIPATLVNNMSAKRQYPTYWGYLPRWMVAKWKSTFGKDDKTKK